MSGDTASLAAALRREVDAMDRIFARAGVRPINAAATTRTIASPPRSAGGYANAVEELRANHPVSVAKAEAAVPAPELFPGSGDYALATASGIDAAAVNSLPWRARLATAWEPNLAKAFRMTQDFGADDGEEHAALELGNHPVVRRYVADVESWFATAGVGDLPGDVPELTPAEDAALFGDRAGRVIPEPQQTQAGT